MNFTHPSHQEMLLSLVNGQVDFLLVGGYAVIYHGYIRTTGDMDVWLRPTNENKEKLLKLFSSMGFDPEGVRQIAALSFLDVVVFHVGHEPERIDFLTKVQGLNFDDAFKERCLLNLKEVAIPILRLDDLLANKLLANRSKDIADVENLIKIKNQKLR